MRKAFARSGVVVTAIGALLLGLASPANAYQTPYVSNLGPEILTYIRVLDIYNSSTADRARAVIYVRNGRSSQPWNIQYRYSRNGHGVYKLVNVHSGKCLDKSLDVPDANGNAVYQYTCRNATNQEWEFIPASGAQARWGLLKNISDGRCLDISGPQWVDNTVLHVWTCYWNWSQRWNID